MPEKIIFLGTAGDKEVIGKQILASGGIVIKTGNNQFLIDPGEGTLVRAKSNKINLRENTAMLTTANDVNTIGDLNSTIDATTIGGLDKKVVIVCNSTVMEGAEGIVSYLNPEQKKNVERILVVRAGQKLGINDTEVHILSSKQKDPNALGFKFITPTASITYLGNTSFFPEMVEEIGQTDILILAVQNPFKEEGEETPYGQLSCDDAAIILEKTKPKVAIITHFGVKMLRKDLMTLGREIQSTSGVQVMMAKDGMTADATALAK